MFSPERFTVDCARDRRTLLGSAPRLGHAVKFKDPE